MLLAGLQAGRELSVNEPDHTGNEYEQHLTRLDQTIDGVRQRLQLVTLGTSLLAIVTCVGAYLLAVVIVDQTRTGGLPLSLRRAFLGGFLTIAALASWRYVIRPLLRQISDLYVAWLIERTHPEFRNSVVTSVQFRNHNELPGSLVAALVAKATDDLDSQPVDRAVRTRALKAAVLGCCCLAGCVALYSLLTPIPLLPSIRRALGEDIAAPTRTQIRELLPVDGQAVIVGQNVRFLAELTGRQPSRVYVQFGSNGGSVWTDAADVQLAPWQPADAGARKGQVWAGSPRPIDVQQSFVWRLRAGDAMSEPRHLEVRPKPDIDSYSLTLTPPRYSRLPSVDRSGGRVEALAGTQVDLRVTTNVPAVGPTIVFGANGESRRQISLSPDDRRLLNARFLVTRDDGYRIEFADELGNANADPIVQPIHVLPDAGPQVVLVRPAEPLELTSQDVLTIEARIEDDFGLTTVEVVAEENGSQRVVHREPIGAEGPKNRSLRLDLPVGQITKAEQADITWWVSARDNCEDLTGKPDYQEGQSEHMRLRVRPPEPLAMAPIPLELPPNKESSEEGVPTEAPTTQQAPGDQGDQGKDGQSGSTDSGSGQNSDSGNSLPEWVRNNKDLIEQAEKMVADAANRSGESTDKDRTPQDPSSRPSNASMPPSASDNGKQKSNAAKESPANGTPKTGHQPGDQQPADQSARGPSSTGQDSPAAETPQTDTQQSQPPSTPSKARTTPSSEKNDDTQKPDDEPKQKNDQGSRPHDPSECPNKEGGGCGNCKDGRGSPGRGDEGKKREAGGTSDSRGEQKQGGGNSQDSEDGAEEPREGGTSPQGGEQKESTKSSRGSEEEGEKPKEDGTTPKPSDKKQDGGSGSSPGAGGGGLPIPGVRWPASKPVAESASGGGLGKPGEGGKGKHKESEAGGGGTEKPQERRTDDKSSEQKQSSGGSGGGSSAGGTGKKAIKPSQQEGKGGIGGGLGGKGRDGGQAGTWNPDSESAPQTSNGQEPQPPPGETSKQQPRQEQTDKQPDESQMTGENLPGELQTIGKIQPLVDEIQRQLRAGGDLDENLLDALEWTPARAAQFVKDFERVVGGQVQRKKTAMPDRQVVEEASLNADRKTLLGEQAGRDVGTRAGDLGIPPDQLRDLRRSEREKVNSSFRPLLEAYYQSLADKSPAKPGKPSASQPAGRP